MNEFNRKGLQIQTDTTEELRKSYLQMIKKHQSYLYQQITEIVHKQIRGIDKGKIQSLVDEYLLTELKYHGEYTINRLDEGLQKAFKETTNTLESKNLDKEQLFKVYTDQIKVPLRRNQMDWIEQATSEFSRQFVRKLDIYFSSLQGISDKNFSKTLDNINSEIRQTMKQYQNKFNQEYQIIQKSFLDKNLNQTSKLINETNLVILKASNLKKYSAIMELSNYALVEENGIFYAKNKENEEMLELILEGDVLRSKDNKIRYTIDMKKKRVGYLNEETKRGIIVHDGLITLMSSKTSESEGKELVSISRKNNKYEFYHNLKSTNDINTIIKIIQEIKNNTPGLYNKLMKDKNFELIIQNIENQEVEMSTAPTPSNELDNIDATSKKKKQK